MDPWSLPAPFDAAAWLAIGAAELAVDAVVRMTRHAATLGPAWALAYWLTVVALWRLGNWGARRMRSVRAGNDAWEYDPSRRGASWLGRAGSVIRLQVAGEAWVAAGAAAVGYLGALALLVAGLVWAWLAVAAGTWAVWQALEMRRRRRWRR